MRVSLQNELPISVSAPCYPFNNTSHDIVVIFWIIFYYFWDFRMFLRFKAGNLCVNQARISNRARSVLDDSETKHVRGLIHSLFH